MNCPVCSSSALQVAERQGIEIDYCTKCRGVWLDRGELDKIIERSSAPAHDDDYDDEDDERRHGRRSHESRGRYPPEGRQREGFFSRLFDFD